MKRLNLFEFEDLSWFPDTIRQGGTDFLRFFLNATKFYNACTPLLLEHMQKTGNTILLDLCSGGGGPMESIVRELDRQSKLPVRILLSDKFPNLNAFRYVQERSNQRIGFIPGPVDALDLPLTQSGLLTMFSAIHHFSPSKVGEILKSAASQKRALAFFDGSGRHFSTILGIVLAQPLLFALFTPFLKPFKLSRFFFTYILPAIPLMTMWDGTASVLRLYRSSELLAIAQNAVPEYEWKAGTLRSGIGFRVTYLTGRPT